MDHSEYFCRVKNANRRKVNALKIKSVLIKQVDKLVFVKTVQLIFKLTGNYGYRKDKY